jgi:tetratricopeptide (TPR) repeat protein
MPCWCKGNCPHVGGPRQLMQSKKPRQAHNAVRQALLTAPFCVEANLMMAEYLTTHNNAAEAGVHIDRAEKMEASARVSIARAFNYKAQDQFDLAIKNFFTALSIEQSPMAYAGLIHTLEADDQIEAAEQIIAEARPKFGTFPAIRRAIASVQAAKKEYGEAVATLSGSAATPIELFERGRYQEGLGNYDAAWADWMTAKMQLTERAGHRYDAERFRQQFSALAEAATPPRPSYMRQAPGLETVPFPLFIAGFPRSGTTMVETALTSHPLVAAGDELMALSEVINALPRWLGVRMSYPQAMIATSLGDNAVIPQLLRDLYYFKARERARFKPFHIDAFFHLGKPAVDGAKYYFTDKMPLNEIHYPLIRCILPDANLFRMQRHPLDVIVSNMAYWIAHGGFYASSLESCATHLAAVDNLVEGYKRHFTNDDAEHYTEVRYEDFVRGPEPILSRMLTPLELDQACLEFHKNPRHAHTISYRQVREPLHDRSIGRFKKFWKYIEQIVPTIKPVLDRQGYEV